MRIVVADDHPLFLVGLRHGLQAAGADVVAAVADGDEAVAACRRFRPDAAVLDVRMPRRDGVAACKTIVDEGLCLVVAMLTTWLDAHVVDAAQEVGARAMLSKEADAVTIVRHLDQVLADPDLRLFPNLHTPTLSERELQVLDGLVRGMSRKRIASHLGLSPETVKDYVASLFAKLDAHDRVTAVTRAVTMGVMALPPVGGTKTD